MGRELGHGDVRHGALDDLGEDVAILLAVGVDLEAVGLDQSLHPEMERDRMDPPRNHLGEQEVVAVGLDVDDLSQMWPVHDLVTTGDVDVVDAVDRPVRFRVILRAGHLQYVGQRGDEDAQDEKNTLAGHDNSFSG